MSDEERRPNGTFVVGHSVRGGRPAGTRSKLINAFLDALCLDFEQNGAAAIKIMRVEKPDQYVRMISTILPKEFAVSDAKLSELSDEDVASLLATVRELRAQSTKAQAERDDAGDSIH